MARNAKPFRDRNPVTIGAISLTVIAALVFLAFNLLIALVLVEMISWHEIDRLLYSHVGPLLLIAYAWIGCAAVVVWAALRR